jgi:hypothetical protein
LVFKASLSQKRLGNDHTLAVSNAADCNFHIYSCCNNVNPKGLDRQRLVMVQCVYTTVEQLVEDFIEAVAVRRST